MSKGSSFASGVAAIQAALDALGFPSMIIGGIAVIAHGVARTTADVDATLWLDDDGDLPRIVAGLEHAGIEPRIADVLTFARTSRVVLLRHTESNVPLDLSLATLPFEREALEGAMERSFAGVSLRVASVEALIIYKMVAARPRDLDDVEQLLARHPSEVDLDRVRKTIEQFSELLEDSTRPILFADITRRLRAK